MMDAHVSCCSISFYVPGIINVVCVFAGWKICNYATLMKSACTFIPGHHRRGRGFGYALSLLRHISLVAAKRFEVVLCRCRCPLLRQAILQISCHETPTQRLHDCSSCAVAAIRGTTQVVLERTDSFLFAGAMLCEPGEQATRATYGLWCVEGGQVCQPLSPLRLGSALSRERYP